ncbi:lytic transglycosylase domain-containing protein [Kutzneria sp. NPDC052558]|uniref:lytic transglycosylase domain-containing protein n=1 Tax=Kutzneria sp. NPDC052558 TaxID=3364121 RepID=UPI0037C866A3
MAIQQSEPAAPPSARPPRVVFRLLVVLVVLAVAGAALWLVQRASTPTPHPVAQDFPALHVTPAPVQVGAAAPAADAAQPSAQAAAAGRSETAEDWLARVSAATGIPARALRAYANADLTLAKVQPSCHLPWTMLAGIGRIESDHGRFGGATLLPNGDESKPIIGVPLDGSGVANISDTDGGALDGDPVHDRAVGPMQFIPSTWRKWASDGNGDGVANPQNIDDATVAAGRYLCAGGRDLATAAGWWAAVLSYNNSVEYGQKVFSVADAAAKASAGH